LVSEFIDGQKSLQKSFLVILKDMHASDFNGFFLKVSYALEIRNL